MTASSVDFMALARQNCPEVFGQPALLTVPEQNADQSVSTLKATSVAGRSAKREEQLPVRPWEAREGASVPVPRVQLTLMPTATLTACLEAAECPATARRIFQVLHELALLSVRARGLPVQPTIGVFHLPVELLAAFLGIDRTTVWRNLKPLIERGVLDARDHFDSLKGLSAVSGKIWAVSLMPERVLKGLAGKVRVTHADLVFPWRDLTADAEAGRTVYVLTRTEERQQAEKAQREAKAAERAAARERAARRATERQAARDRGEKVLTGRAAATVNAAITRNENPRPARENLTVQQSTKGLKTVEKAELIQWVLAPFTQSDDVTLTVAHAFSDGLEAIFSLPTLTALPKRERNAQVEVTARALAASFEDTPNLKFWCWLVWQLLRGADQGQHYLDDVSHLLARVLHDVRHDETCYQRSMKKPAALVVKELNRSGLLDALRELQRYRVGGTPRSKAA